MASLIYDAMVDGMAAGTIRFASDSFAVMLVNGYVPDKGLHNVRADVTGEVSGAGYTAGGAAVTVSVSDAGANQTDIQLGGATWSASTIDATGGVYYDAGSDALVAYIDFGGTISSLNGAFTLQPSTITVNNPT
jgi:hypothetical protein